MKQEKYITSVMNFYNFTNKNFVQRNILLVHKQITNSVKIFPHKEKKGQ